MDREELIAAMQAEPITIRMNDGAEYDIDRADKAIVSDSSAYVLYRDTSDGKLRAAILPLVSIADVLQLERSA